jgi:hypothetical protein
MAERVEIRGGELDGSVLENAASEATLLRLVEALERTSKSSGQGGPDIAAATRLQNLYNESKKKSRTTTDQFTDATKSATSAVSSFASGLSGIAKDLVKMLDRTAAAGLNILFSGATPKVTQFTDALSGILGDSQAIKALGSTVEQVITDFREISSVGADLGTGLLAIKNRAVEANLPLEVFKKIITENAQGLAIYGGSVSKGAMQFAQISGAVQKLRPQFANLGMTMEETGEFTASFLVQQQRMGNLQNMTLQQQTQGAIQYNLELDKMSRATGIQRKALDDANQKIQMETRMRAALGRMLPEERVRFNTRLKQVEDLGRTDLANFMKRMLATGGKVVDAEMGKMILAAGPGTKLPEIFRDLADRVPGAMERLEAEFSKIAGSADNMTTANKNLALTANELGIKIPQFYALEFLGLGELLGSYNAASASQAQALKDSSRGLANFDGAILEARNKLLGAFMPLLNEFMTTAGGFVNLMGPDGPFMQSVKSAAENITGYVNKFIEDVNDVGIIQAFQNMFTKLYTDSLPYVEKYWNELLSFSKAVILPKLSELGESMKKGIYDLFSSPMVVSALVGGIGLLLGGKLIKSAILGIPGSIWDAAKDAKDAYKGAKNPPGGGPVAPGAGVRAGAGAGTSGLAKGLGKQALRFIPGVGLVAGAFDIGSTMLDSNLTPDQKTVGVAGTAGGMGGAATGAAAGAALGTLAGPIGTIIGGILGSIGGYFGGSAAGKSIAEKSITDIRTQKPTPSDAGSPATKTAPESKSTMPEKTSAITDTNTQLVELNNTMTRVATLIEESNKHLSKVQQYTRASSGNLVS